MLKILKNKYWLSGIIFICWLAFIDKDSFWVQYKLYQQYKDLEFRKNRLEKDMSNIQEQIKTLKENPQRLEQYARENYLMKKDNETMFILIEK